jgi:formate/nitrite transporter
MRDARETASLDALLPPEMARRAEAIGVAKASMDGVQLLALASLAGAFIALGGVVATTALAGTGTAPWGPSRILAGLAFSLGLILVVVGGAELFTGNNLIVMAWAGRRITTGALVRNWLIVYAGNFAGAAATALVVYLAGTHRFGDGAFGVTALELAAAKLRFSPVQAVALGVLCNVLVCLAVWLSYSARTTADRILAVVPPIAAFVAAGFEHSVANMYFVPLGLAVAALDPGFVAARGLEAEARALTWTAFLVRNLLPVTVGNAIGGTGLVGLVYWFVYLRPRGATRHSVPEDATATEPGRR